MRPEVGPTLAPACWWEGSGLLSSPLTPLPAPQGAGRPPEEGPYLAASPPASSNLRAPAHAQCPFLLGLPRAPLSSWAQVCPSFTTSLPCSPQPPSAATPSPLSPQPPSSKASAPAPPFTPPQPNFRSPPCATLTLPCPCSLLPQLLVTLAPPAWIQDPEDSCPSSHSSHRCLPASHHPPRSSSPPGVDSAVPQALPPPLSIFPLLTQPCPGPGVKSGLLKKPHKALQGLVLPAPLYMPD